jgi:hypothetical protein
MSWLMGLVMGTVMATAACSGGSGARVKESGRILAYGTTMGVPGANVEFGGATATTAADGTFSLEVLSGTTSETVFTAPGYYKAIAQEWQLTNDVVRSDIHYAAASQWTSFIPDFVSLGGAPYDPTLGLVTLVVTALPSCASTGGATVAISPTVSATRTLYTDDTGVPSMNPSTSAEPVPVHAVLYNVPVGEVAMTIASPTCTQAPWPVTAESTPGGGKYVDTGRARVEAGNAVSYLRLYLK